MPLRLNRPGPIKQKCFTSKNNLPILDDYGVILSASQWVCWTNLKFEDVVNESWLNPVEFSNTAFVAGYKDINHIHQKSGSSSEQQSYWILS